MKLLQYTEPGEAGFQVAEAMASYFTDVGIQATLGPSTREGRQHEAGQGNGLLPGT